jgi:hypothetical protein
MHFEELFVERRLVRGGCGIGRKYGYGKEGTPKEWGSDLQLFSSAAPGRKSPLAKMTAGLLTNHSPFLMARAIPMVPIWQGDSKNKDHTILAANLWSASISRDRCLTPSPKLNIWTQITMYCHLFEGRVKRCVLAINYYQAQETGTGIGLKASLGRNEWQMKCFV